MIPIHQESSIKERNLSPEAKKNKLSISQLESWQLFLTSGILSSANARFFLLVHLCEKKNQIQGRVDTKKKKKSSENDQLPGHFLFFLFYISRKKPSKTSKVNQQSLLNL